MNRFRILFLGTPEFAVPMLEQLFADECFEIVGVITQPDRPAGRKMQLKASAIKELALAKGLKVFSPETVNTPEFRAEVQALGAESAAVVAFGQILGQKFLDLFPRGCVNVHASVLPRWRGAAPIQRAVMAGDRESGVSLQVIVRQLDAGPLLGLRRIAIPESMNSLELHDHLQPLGAELLLNEYADYLRGSISPEKQDETLVTIAAKIEKSEAMIDWNVDVHGIHNRIRGLAMSPFAQTSFEGRALKIHKTEITRRDGRHGAPGQVLTVDSANLEVACGTGALRLLVVQPESRSRLAIGEYLRGHVVKAGDIFA